MWRGSYPWMTAGSTCLVFPLLDPHPQQPAPIVSALALARFEGPQSRILADGIKQDMDVSCSTLGDTLSQDAAGQFPLPPAPQDCPDFQLYEYISQLVVRYLRNTDLLLQDVPKPPFWLSHHPRGIYQAPGSCSSSSACAGVSHVSIHGSHLSSLFMLRLPFTRYVTLATSVSIITSLWGSLSTLRIQPSVTLRWCST